MYCWLFVNYYENDGSPFLDKPKVFRTKKGAMAAYNARVKEVLEEEIGEEDEITNRIETEGNLHLCVNNNTYYTIYAKKVKVIE